MIWDDLLKWYDGYAASFKTGDRELEDAVSIKCGHTQRVIAEIRQLCNSMSLDPHRSELANIAALFHDVARFEQFRRYRTFSDFRSINHAAAAVDILSANRLLAPLDPADARTVIAAIRHHNAANLPNELAGDGQLLCKLLRDADKLDIYKVVIDHYSNPLSQRNETMQLGFPDGEDVSPEICAEILANKNIAYEKIVSLVDFKIVQHSWVFDLNFPHSVRCVKQRDYIRRIQQYLPSTEDVLRIVDHVEAHLNSRMQGIQTSG